MSFPRIRVIPPESLHREGEIVSDGHGFEYQPRFLRESFKRTGASHMGPVLVLEVVDAQGRLERHLQSVTVMVDDSGEIRLLQEQIVQPSFLIPTEHMKERKPQ